MSRYACREYAGTQHLRAAESLFRHPLHLLISVCLKPNRRSSAPLQAHKVPESEFENNLTRFDVPVSALAYGPDGKMLAAACEDGVMKLVQVADQRVSCGCRAGRCTRQVAYQAGAAEYSVWSSDLLSSALLLFVRSSGRWRRTAASSAWRMIRTMANTWPQHCRLGRCRCSRTEAVRCMIITNPSSINLAGSRLLMIAECAECHNSVHRCGT